jgi:nucleoid DNA-binding protein
MPARANTASKKAAKQPIEEVEEVEEDVIEEEVDEDVIEEEVDEEDAGDAADGDAADDDDDDKQRKRSSAVPAAIVKMVKDAVSDELDITLKSTKLICDALFKVIIDQVEAGENVTLTNHFTFKRVYRAERTHKVISTGESMTKPEHYTMTVQVKPALKNRLFELEVDAEDRQAYMDKKNGVKKTKSTTKTAADKKTAAKK